MSEQTPTRVRDAMHRVDIDLTDRTGPFILTACIGADGTVWAALTDAVGLVVTTTPLPIKADEVCWDCVKGRHAICTPDGRRCECPVCHGNRYVDRQPAWDPQTGTYYDPGPEA